MQNKLIAIAVCAAVFDDAAERDRSFVVPLVYALFSEHLERGARSRRVENGQHARRPGRELSRSSAGSTCTRGSASRSPSRPLCDVGARRADAARPPAAGGLAGASLELELASTRSPRGAGGELGC